MTLLGVFPFMHSLPFAPQKRTAMSLYNGKVLLSSFYLNGHS